MKNPVRYSKCDSFVKKVDLIEANPMYVRVTNRKETIISIVHIVPFGEEGNFYNRGTESIIARNI